MYCQESITDVQADLRQPTQNYLRAILRPPPHRFSVSHFLSTGKSSSKYHHGMHISSNRISISSRESHSEYDIRRSWDDCLWFQQSLEVEYEQAAREKKLRLMQGKGVKGFNGIYKRDLASSWESLPPGPSPNSIAQDIHEYLPPLTKRGTLFRASQATIDQRQAELTALVEALFSDNMPALIKEIRVSTIVSDFFGQWRRDYEYVEESQKAGTAPRNSLTSSIFSSYFSASHPTLPSSDSSSRNSSPNMPYKRSQLSTTPRPLSSASLTEISEEPGYPCGSPRRSRSRPHSTSSDSSAHSESSSDTSLSSSSGPAIADDAPIVFGHNPLNPSGWPNSILEVLPEDREILSKPPEPYQHVKPKPRSSTTKKANRSYSIFGLSLKESLLPAEKSGDRSIRESWQTTDSQASTANDLFDGLGLVLPHPIKEQKFRASIASISTFMTTSSADAVIPRTHLTATASRPCSFESSIRIPPPLSLPDFDSDTDDNAFPRPNSFIPESRPETPVGDLSLPDSPSSTCTASDRPASPTCSALSSSVFSTTTSTSFPADPISIKAIHNTCIILLRVSREIGFADVRQRLYNKFIGQEGIPLSQTYTVAFVPPSPAPPTATRSQLASANQADVQLITLESDWEQLMSTLQGNKITLRILDISTS